jgi:hypothetical protein
MGLADRSTREPSNHRKVFDLVPGAHRHAFRSKSLNLPPADSPQLDRADDPVRSYDPEPGQVPGLFGRERGEDKGNLASRDTQVMADGPIGGDPAFRNRRNNFQDLRLETPGFAGFWNVAQLFSLIAR